MLMRLPAADQRKHGFVIDRIAHDFDLLDVWGLPVEGGPEQFDEFVDVLQAIDPADASPASRLLFAVRFQLGRWFGWDAQGAPQPIPGATETTLRQRLPEELRDSVEPTPLRASGQHEGSAFVPLFRNADEWAAEISNATVHGVLHVSWPEQSPGRHRAQLAVYVKPRGRFGSTYLRLIEPFRHVVVYPAMTRQIGRAWEEHRRASAS